jgi:hypothetical protein
VGATGKANSLPVFLLLLVVAIYFCFCQDVFDSAQSATQLISLSSKDY